MFTQGIVGQTHITTRNRNKLINCQTSDAHYRNAKVSVAKPVAFMLHLHPNYLDRA